MSNILLNLNKTTVKVKQILWYRKIHVVKTVLAFVDSMGSDKNVAVVRNRGYQTADGIAKAIGHMWVSFTCLTY